MSNAVALALDNQPVVYAFAIAIGFLALFVVRLRWTDREVANGSDLVWILVGGLGAASAVYAQSQITKIELLKQEAEALDYKKSSFVGSVRLFLASDCAISPLFEQFNSVLIQNCDRLEKTVNFIRDNPHLFEFPNTRENFERMLFTGRTRTEKNTFGNPPIIADIKKGIGQEQSIYFESLWYCLERNGNQEQYCSYPPQSMSAELGNKIIFERDIFTGDNASPIVAVRGALEYSSSILNEIGTQAAKIRDRWELVFRRQNVEFMRLLAIAALAFVFPLRLWKSYVSFKEP